MPKREYKIFKTDLWFSIYRKKENWKLITLQYLSWKDNRITNKTLARTFYHKEDALSTLVVVRRKDVWKESD